LIRARQKLGLCRTEVPPFGDYQQLLVSKVSGLQTSRCERRTHQAAIWRRGLLDLRSCGPGRNRAPR